MSRTNQTQYLITKEARNLGFEDVGFVPIKRLDEDADKLKQWLERGYHGSMSYMENHFEKRVNPAELVPGSNSIIVLTHNYFIDIEKKSPKLSIYALGEDYHRVIKRKLKKLIRLMKSEFQTEIIRGFVDSAPVLERQWAELAGLGWRGKNTLLINPKKGSYFFLAVVISDLIVKENPDPIKNHCGTCSKCIDNCPTGAIDLNGYILDASKCISYLTIEHKGSVPDEFQGKMDDWIFGCDVCQEVCPWNRFSKEHTDEELKPYEKILQMTSEEWLDLTPFEFDKTFNKSPLKRTGFDGIQRNLNLINN
jgi:epoxyqueuosine reductase